jgi:hypothetical protein
VIKKIIDLGGIDVPMTGVLKLSQNIDGQAAIGELVYIGGDNFGRKPTVKIGGRPVSILGRTVNEGLLLRVPGGTPGGEQPVVVTNAAGSAEKPFPVKRLALLVTPKPGSVAWVSVSDEGPKAAGFMDVVGAHRVRLSADGRAAYVLGSPGAQLTIFDLTAVKEPQPVNRAGFGPAHPGFLVAASTAQVLALVMDDSVVMFDITSPLRPVRKPPAALPALLTSAKVRRVEMSPDGKLLGFLAADRNQLFIVDVARLVAVDEKDKAKAAEASNKAVVATLAIEPDVRVPVLVDLAFSPEGETLWVVSGDNPASAALGAQPTKVYAVRVRTEKDGAVKVELARTVTIPNTSQPVRVATSRSQPLASGASVRLPSEKATVFVTAALNDAKGARTVVLKVGADDASSEVLAVAGKDRVGGVDVTPEDKWLVGVTSGDDGSIRFAFTSVDGRAGAMQSLEAVQPSLHAGAPVLSAGTSEIRVQP